MKIYECVKELEVDCYDEKGHYEDKGSVIEIGSIWLIEDEQDDFRMIGADVRLTKQGNSEYSWLEISKDNLEEYFEEKVVNNSLIM